MPDFIVLLFYDLTNSPYKLRVTLPIFKARFHQNGDTPPYKIKVYLPFEFQNAAQIHIPHDVLKRMKNSAARGANIKLVLVNGNQINGEAVFNLDNFEVLKSNNVLNFINKDYILLSV